MMGQSDCHTRFPSFFWLIFASLDPKACYLTIRKYSAIGNRELTKKLTAFLNVFGLRLPPIYGCLQMTVNNTILQRGGVGDGAACFTSRGQGVKEVKNRVKLPYHEKRVGMDTLRKQASKLRDQVAKQQQAVIKQFGGSGYESSEVMVIDEVELQMHHQLEKLYRSTRGGRDFQKDIVKAAEAFTAIGYKHIEAGTKLSEDCSRYGIENSNDEILAKTASIYGEARRHVEKEQEDLNQLLFSQVLEPLRALISGSPLEDARHLAQRYSRMRQEAEAQATEVSRRQARVRESPIPENVAKLHAAESKMQEHKANMAILGKEAATALAAVESQQQRLTFQRFVAMVEGERTYHERVATILGNIETEMVSEKQRKEAAPPVAPLTHTSEKTNVTSSGWSEGECQGRAGWFPTSYVEKRQRIPTNYTGSEVY
ncbi:intersectin-2-like [Dorcoceras hygrometricum]|uniref:Intersectin-2-like n=1 Tax=Dorcoceras hygrometricum TaxID=472368 RepID=A0A2Z7D218_9LAMI|nr:intersectin-2-like [Dorcoceras hygrometricum]